MRTVPVMQLPIHGQNGVVCLVWLVYARRLPAANCRELSWVGQGRCRARRGGSMTPARQSSGRSQVSLQLARQRPLPLCYSCPS